MQSPASDQMVLSQTLQGALQAGVLKYGLDLVACSCNCCANDSASIDACLACYAAHSAASAHPLLHADPALRRQSEARLAEASKQGGFGPALVDLVLQVPAEGQICRHAASIMLTKCMLKLLLWNQGACSKPCRTSRRQAHPSDIFAAGPSPAWLTADGSSRAQAVHQAALEPRIQALLSPGCHRCRKGDALPFLALSAHISASLT